MSDTENPNPKDEFDSLAKGLAENLDEKPTKDEPDIELAEEDNTPQVEVVEQKTTNTPTSAPQPKETFWSKHLTAAISILVFVQAIILVLIFLVANNMNSTEKKLSAKTTYIYDELDSLNTSFEELVGESKGQGDVTSKILVQQAGFDDTLKEAITRMQVTGSNLATSSEEPTDLQNLNSALRLIVTKLEMFEERMLEQCAEKKQEVTRKPKAEQKREGKYYIYTSGQ